MIGIIVAATRDRVIGLDGRIPWHYPADLKRFKRLTLGGAVIMGRATYESILGFRGSPLPKRHNIIVSRQDFEGVTSVRSVDAALAAARERGGAPVWFIGGARIYEAGLAHAELVDLTRVPDTIDDPAAVRFPVLPDGEWVPEPPIEHPEDPRLTIERYRRAG